MIIPPNSSSPRGPSGDRSDAPADGPESALVVGPSPQSGPEGLQADRSDRVAPVAATKGAATVPTPHQWDSTHVFFRMFDLNSVVNAQRDGADLVYPGFYLYRLARTLEDSPVATPLEPQRAELTRAMTALGFSMMQESPGTPGYAVLGRRLEALGAPLNRFLADAQSARGSAPSPVDQQGWVLRRYLVEEAAAIFDRSSAWDDPLLSRSGGLLGQHDASHRLASMVKLLEESLPPGALRPAQDKLVTLSKGLLAVPPAQREGKVAEWRSAVDAYLEGVDTLIKKLPAPTTPNAHAQRIAQFSSDFVGMHQIDKRFEASFEDSRSAIRAYHRPTIQRLSRLLSDVQFDDVFDGRPIKGPLYAYREALVRLDEIMGDVVAGGWSEASRRDFIENLHLAHEDGQHGVSRLMDGRNGDNGTTPADPGNGHGHDHSDHQHG